MATRHCIFFHLFMYLRIGTYLYFLKFDIYIQYSIYYNAICNLSSKFEPYFSLSLNQRKYNSELITILHYCCPNYQIEIARPFFPSLPLALITIISNMNIEKSKDSKPTSLSALISARPMGGTVVTRRNQLQYFTFVFTRRNLQMQYFTFVCPRTNQMQHFTSVFTRIYMQMYYFTSVLQGEICRCNISNQQASTQISKLFKCIMIMCVIIIIITACLLLTEGQR